MGTITKIIKNGKSYSLSTEGIEQILELAEEYANKSGKAFTQAQRVVTSTQKLIGGYLIPIFDSGESYYKYDLVMHGDTLYRCIEDRGPGEWNQNTDACFMETSFYNEIKDMRGFSNYETVIIKGSVNLGDQSVYGKKVYITYSDSKSSLVELEFNENGIASVSHLKGSVYSVSCEDIAGYATPRVKTYIANLNERTISLVYKLLNTGIYVIDEDGNETDILLWDPANNFKSKLIKFTDSDLSQANSSFAIEIHNRRTFGSQTWCIENTQFASIPNLGDGTLARSDFDGYSNTQKILEEAVGKVESYNTAHPTAPTTVNAYVQAFATCNNVTIDIGGETFRAFLPSSGQMLKMFKNLSDINQALIFCGGTAISFSGDWWCSSQRSWDGAWCLGRGSLGSHYKFSAGSVVPVFDF